MIRPYLYIYVITLLISACSTSDSAECDQAYGSLDSRHRQIMAMQPGSEAFHTLMQAIEDDIFSSMKECPGDPGILTLMAEIQISQGQYPLAELYARKALEYDPEYWQAHSVLGASLVGKQQYAEGIRHLEQAVTLTPENPALQLNLCQAYVMDGQPGKARPLCEQVASSSNGQMAELANKILTDINKLDSSTR